MAKKKTRAQGYRTRMSGKERTLYPKVIDESVEPGMEGEYTISIVSSGSVHATPDPVLGNRYYYGNPELAKGKPVRQKGISSAKIKLSKVVETSDLYQDLSGSD